MKKLILIGFLALAACKKSTIVTTPGGGTVVIPPVTKSAYHDVPFWKDDTLYGSAINSGVMQNDTAYAVIAGGHTYIKYPGIQYQIKVYVATPQVYSDSSGSYWYHLFDMAGNAVTDTSSMDPNLLVTTYRYYDKPYGNWKDQIAAIGLPHQPPFNQDITAYFSY